MLTQRRILLVDDDLENLEILRMLLEISGHDARAFNRGEPALQVVPSFEPELVVCGLALRDMSGLDVAARLGRFAARKRMLLVALTGYGGDQTDSDVRAAGFDMHLTKPVHFKAIEELIALLPAR